MATAQQLGGWMWAQNSGADLSGSVNLFAKVDTDGDLILGTNGGICAGVIVEGAVADKATSIQIGGIAKIVAGAAVTAGVEVQSNGSGQAIAYSSGFKAGRAMTGCGASGELISVLLA